MRLESMKSLILIRHAKSSWDNLSVRDIERPLNKRGELNAPFMGKVLKEKYKIQPDLILSSPAVRAMQTAKIISTELNYPEDKIIFVNRLYTASRTGLLEVIGSLEDDKQCVIIFGHNPELTELSNFLSGEYIDNIPTCGIVKLLRGDSWKNPGPKSFKLEFFIYPKAFSSGIN